MKYYYIGSIPTKPLGAKLGKYLGMKMNYVYCSAMDKIKFNKEDIVYTNGILERQFYEKATVVAPPVATLSMWNNKIYQYHRFFNKIPTPKFKIFKDSGELINFLKTYNEKLFLTSSFGTGGNQSIIYNGKNFKQIIEKFNGLGEIRASKFINKDSDISVHLFIYDKDNVVMSPVAEQTIAEDGVSFEGGVYPAKLSKLGLMRLQQYCFTIGQILSDSGYRGMTGVDFMVSDNEIYFTELNPRIMTTSIGISKVMEAIWGVSIPVLTYQILMEDKKPNLKIIGDYNKRWKMKVKGVGLDFKEF
jgi:phosphoribosylaminoimidazole carboxylase (NCAIR synthetase)